MLKKFNIAVVFLFIVFELLLIQKKCWSGDFWEHSAVVSELSKHLLHPNNPIIKSNIPHAFFSPYSVIVAVFSKITHFNSIQSLGCFAFFNLLFFLFTFYLFCKSLFKEDYLLIAPLALFFILFFWGQDPFIWSGFYHILVLNLVLPYPSTFAMSLSFLALSLLTINQAKKSFLIDAAISILCASVLITHPTTAIFLFISIVALCFSFNNYSIKSVLTKCLIIFIPCFILCLLWPYYNIVHLFMSNSADFNNESKMLYTKILRKNWPIILIIPGLLLTKRDRVSDFFLLSIIAMISIYALGFAFKFYGISRIVSNIIMFSHFLIAYNVIRLFKTPKLAGKIYLGVIFVCVLISLGINYQSIKNVFLATAKKDDISYYTKYQFLRNFVQPDDVILSDLNSSWIIPSFNGKVIPSIHPLYWVNDIEERRTDVNAFFEKQNADSIRALIIQKYKPNYILIDSNVVSFDSLTLVWLNTIGQTVYKENHLKLIKLKK